ncbi:MAG: 2-oxoglutarate dehydrogenase complex dihydrolipoyllysine-residue succinyltransferase [Pseudomonadales bacterium]|nr:2-oxoglutarate dehydrogenase complex dihydrolipoyllysine-residue succinyltransferase [Pseudomonadales bacterium]
MADSESVDIKAPEFPESVADGEVATWHVQIGEAVRRDQVIVDIETDKVVLEVVAPADGKLIAIIKEEGETVLADELLATFEAGDGAGGSTVPAAVLSDMDETSEETDDVVASPAARKIAQEQGLSLDQVAGTGKDGRITKEDVVKAVADAQKPPSRTINTPVGSIEQALVVPGERVERRVPMTRIRASIARRLVDAQQTAAMLTTFNEVDMKPIMDLRSRYKDEFEKAHNGTRLGFMSFFVRSSIEALKRFPVVNASIDGNDIVYHGYQDVGVAVSSPRGLVVPVLRDADSLTLAEIEVQIREFGTRAQENKLSIDDMTGGTFTISNGGVFGSLLSTPILNPPQTAILGMHKIADRPMAVDGEVEIRPMMYLALSYDHRLIDGQEAVRFLVTIKDFLEEPARILLDL